MLTKDTFKFLGELKKHNERPWFEKNKARYESQVRDPMLDLVAALQPRLRQITRHVVVDPRSVMRIYRDVRFSKDKSPYKTYLAAMFWHSDGKESPSPGYYLHVEPGGKTMLGGGVWRPEGAALKRIRDAIAGDAAGWKKVTSGLLKGGACSMIGESLKRPPPGYDPEHPLIEDLKRKDFCVSMTFGDAKVVSARFADEVGKGAEKMAPLMKFLAGAVGADF